MQSSELKIVLKNVLRGAVGEIKEKKKKKKGLINIFQDHLTCKKKKNIYIYIYTLVKNILYTNLTYYDHSNKNYDYKNLGSTKIRVVLLYSQYFHNNSITNLT